MHVNSQGHLTYCTNIHPGETWPEVLKSLDHALQVKARLSPDHPFGIGLRLSAQAARQLSEGANLPDFKQWLEDHQCYVFTMNGFPYGGFHRTVVKDQVHAPDWTTDERVSYTKLLFDQLAYLLPEEINEGGISTSPLSYRLWFKGAAALADATEKATRNMIEVVAHLIALKQTTGKSLHLDIEPEPDGILENSEEFIHFYDEILLGKGAKWLCEAIQCTHNQAVAAIREHISLCYDVCHFAVAYEEPSTVLEKMAEKRIPIGKIQISAAVKSTLGRERSGVLKSLQPYNESTYLHQTVFATRKGKTVHYPDLGPALEALDQEQYTELRTHFHVPIFTDTYGDLQSTQDEIVKVLELWKANPFSHHLEVETYTWEVLPENNQLGLTDSIYRELDWVLNVLNKDETNGSN